MFKRFYLGILLVLPAIVSAQGVLTKTKGLFGGVKDIVSNVLIPLVFTLALLFFFYGVAKYIWQEGGGKEDGRKIMLWGIVALFVMSSVWGLVAFIRGELNINNPDNIKIPRIGGSGGGSSGGSDDTNDCLYPEGGCN